MLGILYVINSHVYTALLMKLDMKGLHVIRYDCSNHLSLLMMYHFSCCIQISQNLVSRITFQQEFIFIGV